MNHTPSISDVRNFVEGNYKFATKSNLPTYQLEQIELRKFLCGACLDNKSCTICGCKTPNVFFAPQKIDAAYKWGPFMSEIQWSALKNNIDQYATFIKSLNTTTNV